MAKLIRAGILRMSLLMRGCAIGCLSVAMLLGSPRAEAQTADVSETETQVKAAYLYKLGSYVEWPEKAFAGPASPLVIGLIDANALADELTQVVAGRVINGRAVTVRKLGRNDPLTGINVLFIGRSLNTRLAETLSAARQQPILTVSESEEAFAAGSMINFVVIDGKVRFEVSPKAAGLSHLSISARLLAAAYRVAPGSLAPLDEFTRIAQNIWPMGALHAIHTKPA